jgi:hypothetical protein
MQTRAFLLCAGVGDRWNNHLGIPKQLIAFRGETLLARTQRLLRERGVSDIVVVTCDERLHCPGASLHRPRARRWVVETFLSTSSLWCERNLVLLGDVFYSEAIVDQLCSSRRAWRFFGRPDDGAFSGRLFGEIFGVAFFRPACILFEKHLGQIIGHAEMTGEGKLWHLYRSLNGFSLGEHRITAANFCAVQDQTEDFDLPEHYARCRRRYHLVTSPSPLVSRTVFLLYRWTPSWRVVRRAVRGAWRRLVGRPLKPRHALTDQAKL